MLSGRRDLSLGVFSVSAFRGREGETDQKQELISLMQLWCVVLLLSHVALFRSTFQLSHTECYGTGFIGACHHHNSVLERDYNLESNSHLIFTVDIAFSDYKIMDFF